MNSINNFQRPTFKLYTRNEPHLIKTGSIFLLDFLNVYKGEIGIEEVMQMVQNGSWPVILTQIETRDTEPMFIYTGYSMNVIARYSDEKIKHRDAVNLFASSPYYYLGNLDSIASYWGFLALIKTLHISNREGGKAAVNKSLDQLMISDNNNNDSEANKNEAAIWGFNAIKK